MSQLLLADSGLEYRIYEDSIIVGLVAPDASDLEETLPNSQAPTTETNAISTGSGSKPSFLASAAAALLTAFATAPASAQDEIGASGVGLEEIVVTARKREESLQDVPIAVTVVSGDILREENIRKLEDLAPTLPNFFHAESVSGNDQIAVRGIASGVNFGFENSVGQVFDGVFFGRARFGRSLFMDLERVEILKGPQGALIGKNTTAGAISLTSAKPTDTLQGYIAPAWDFEGDEGWAIEGALSGPLAGETLTGRLSFRVEERDGWLRNLTRNTNESQREEQSIRAQLNWNISENFSASLLYQYSNQEREGRNNEPGACLPPHAAQVATLGDDCTFNYTNSRILLVNGEELQSQTDTEPQLGILTLDWDTDNGTFTSVTALSEYEMTDYLDNDGLSPEGNSIKLSEKFEQFSQEFRFASTGDNIIDYTFGAYYQDIDRSTRFQLDFNAMGPAPAIPNFPPFARARNNRFTDEVSEAYAIFGEVSWNISDQWRLLAGLRYTDEEKTARSWEFPTVVYTDIPRPPAPFGPGRNVHDVVDTRSESHTTPSLTLQWFPNDDTMLYGKVQTGFKGGGFDAQFSGNRSQAESDLEFEDVEVTAYEVGGKFTFPDSRVRLNIAAFRSEFKDLQVSTLLEGSGTVFRVGNAASATTQGIEADITWVPVDGLNLTILAAYLDAKYDDYPDAPCYSLQTPATGCVDDSQNLSGKTLQYAPEWAFNFQGRYTWALTSELEMTFFGRAYFNDDTALALNMDPRTFQDAYWRFDASIEVADVNGRWRVSLVGRNLSDELTANWKNASNARRVNIFSMPPRTFGLQAEYRFGE